MTDPVIVHATTVAVNRKAVLIQGPSGSGKSSLALELLAYGARLVADDRTILQKGQDGPVASCPPTIAGQIEARGVGILDVQTVPSADVSLVIDLSLPDPPRLPETQQIDLLGWKIPLWAGSSHGHFAASVYLWLSNH